MTLPNNTTLYYSYYLLGNIYCNLRRFKEGKKYYLEALKICDEYKNIKLFAYREDIYFYLSMANLELGDYKQAYKYATIPNSEVCGEYAERTCLEYCNLGRIYLGLDSLKKAEYYINKSLLLSDSIKEKWIKMISLQTKVKLLKKQSGNKNLRQTILAIEQIIDSGEDLYSIFEGYKQLTDYYKSTGDYKKALYYLEKWTAVNDTLKSKESLQVFNEFQTKYETDKKEQQILQQQKELQAKTRLLWISILSGTAILIALILIISLYNKRNLAYKQLVYQSIENASVNSFSSIDFNRNNNDEEATENKTTKSTLLSENQIITLTQLLDEQLKKKIFLEPDISLDKLADLCGTNRNYISNLINRNHELNFNSFINKLRIEESIKIMINEQNNVQLKNLYKRLGYNSYTVFNDAFKKHTGVTPKIFLNTIIQDKKNNQISELNDSIDIKNQQTL